MGLTEARGFRIAVMLGTVILVVVVVALAVVGVRSLAAGPTQSVATPTATDSPPSAEPSIGPQNTCLDGLQVTAGAQCDLFSDGAIFGVAGVTADQCTQIADPPGNAAGQTFTCTLDTGEMQVGRFVNTSAKAARITTYRRYHYCAPYENTWQVCGGGGMNQGWLRVYLADDLLMYMSSKDKGVLLSLDGVSEDTVRHGR